MKNKIISLSFAFAVATSSSFAIAMEQNVETVEQTTVQDQPAQLAEKKDSPVRRMVFTAIHAAAFIIGIRNVIPSTIGCGVSVIGFIAHPCAEFAILSGLMGAYCAASIWATSYGANGLYNDIIEFGKDIKNA